MPFAIAVIFLLVVCATGLAIVCVVLGLSFLAIKEYRTVAAYIALVYPAMFLGCALGVHEAWRLSAFVKGVRPHWEWQVIAVLVMLTSIIVGAAAGGGLGYVFASRIAKHFSRSR